MTAGEGDVIPSSCPCHNDMLKRNDEEREGEPSGLVDYFNSLPARIGEGRS